MLTKIFFIFLFYLLGEGIAILIGNFIPGSVIGMILLFLALLSKIISPNRIDTAAKALISNMVLFFLPPTIGIMTVLPILGENIVAIVVTFTVSTMCVIAIVGLLQQWISKMGRSVK